MTSKTAKVEQSELASFERRNDLTRYHGLPLQRRRITIAADAFDIIALKDAATLLDDAKLTYPQFMYQPL